MTRLLTRKTAPKGAIVYIAGELAHGDHALRRAMEEACDLLGTDIETGTYGTRSGRNPLAKLLSTANDGRAQVISLGIILAAQEAATSTGSWRHVQPDTARYLTFLAEQGYPLAHVEQRARGQEVLPEDADPNEAES